MIKARSARNTLSFIAAIVAILLSPVHSLAQNSGCISGQVIGGPSGKPVPFALVRVCSSAATGVPCSPLVSVFYDPNLTRPITQPFSTDANGVWTACMAGAATYFIQTVPVIGTTYSTYNSVGIGNIGPGGPYIQTAPSTNQTVTQPGGTTLSVNLLNLPGTVSGTPTISGLWAFGSGITGTGNTGALLPGAGILGTANIFTAKQIIPNVNNTIYVDGTTYPLNDTGIHAAMAACVAQGGGTVTPIANVTITSTLTLGNSTTKPPCHLDLGYGNGVTLTINVTDGTAGIAEGDGSCILGKEGFGPFSPTYYGSRILFPPTANVSVGITEATHDGTQQGFCIYGVNLQGNASATIPVVLDVGPAFSGTFIRDVKISNFPAIGYRELAYTGANSGNTVHYVANLVINGSDVAGTRPMVILAQTGVGNADLDYYHMDIEAAGAGQALIEITGNGDGANTGTVNTARNINFFGGYFEGNAIAGNNIGFKITDAHAINIYGFSAAGSGSDMVQLNQTGVNDTGLINIVGLYAGNNNWTNLINNTINSDVKPVSLGGGQSIANYTFNNMTGGGTFNSQFASAQAESARFAPASGGVNGVSLNGNVKPLGTVDVVNNATNDVAFATTGNLAGAIHMLPLGGVNGGQNGITFGANTGGAINTLANAALLVDSSGGFGTRMHFCTTGAFGSYTCAWKVNFDGKLLAELDNTYDIGASGATRPRTGYFGTSVVVPTVNATTGYQVGGNQVIDSSRNADIATIKDITGTYTMGMTFKRGSGGGNYTGANTGYANVDTTNLCAVFTIPTGWKLAVTSSGVVESVTAAVAQSFAISDIGTTCGGAGVTPLAGSERIVTPPAIATFDIGITMQALIAGDGAAHAISLQAKTSNASDSWGIQNSSSSAAPAMTFTLMPSN